MHRNEKSASSPEFENQIPLPHSTFYWQSLHFIWCSQALGNLLNCQLCSFPTTTHSFSPVQEKSSECRFADMLHSHALPGEYIMEAFWNSTMSFHYRASQNSGRIVCYFFSPGRKGNCLFIHTALETVWEWETSRLKQSVIAIWLTFSKFNFWLDEAKQGLAKRVPQIQAKCIRDIQMVKQNGETVT